MKWNPLACWLARRRRPVRLCLAALLLSLAAAFCAWVVGYHALFGPDTDLGQLRSYWWLLYGQNLPLWSLALPAVFALHSFYTRWRAYRSWRRLVVLGAVATAFLTFFFVGYFLLRTAQIPHGVMLAGLLLTLLTVGGARRVVLPFRSRYRQERPTGRRPIRTVLVVGGGGYIGAVLVRRLLQRGYNVRVLDCFLYGSESLEELTGHPTLEVRQGDFRHIPTVVKAVQGCDAVLHLAAIVGDSACSVDEEAARQINYAATRLLAEVASSFHVSRFLFASSCSVYGTGDRLMDEHSRLNPLSLYARTKVDSEAALLAQKSAAFCPVVLRLATSFGLSPRPRFDLVMNLLAARALTGSRITIHNGAQWRPFIHVEDIARAFIACLEAPRHAVHGEIFNIGSDRLNHNLKDLAAKIQAVLPGTEVEYTNDADARNYRVSFKKAEHLLQFRCEKTIEDGLRELQLAFLRGQIGDYRNPRYSNHVFLEHHARAGACQEASFVLWDKAAACA